jgi:hypothetical protein
MSMAQVQDLSVQWNRLAGGFLLPRERVAGGMVPKYLVERIEAILRGSPLPARSSEREQVQGRLVRAYLWIAGGGQPPYISRPCHRPLVDRLRPGLSMVRGGIKDRARPAARFLDLAPP